MGIKTGIANLSAKATRGVLKLFRKSGTQLTGTVALKIDKDFLKNTRKPDHLIAVTGTNGKTTTCNMIADVLELLGNKVLTNRTGSNTQRGIASAFANQMSMLGKNPDFGVLEEDEIWMRHINKYLDIKTLTVTNLYQDSYDRNANVKFIVQRINEGIPKGTKLILNASDSISAYLGSEDHERVYFTIKPLEGEMESKESKIQDMVYCPRCETDIEWTFNRYHHIGEYHCPNCDFTNPQADYEVSAIDTENNLLRLTDHGEKVTLPLIHYSIENSYNQLAAYATLRENGFSYEELNRAMAQIEVVKSRLKQDFIGKKEVISIVAKGLNPVATSRIINNVGNAQGPKTVVYVADYEQRDLPNATFSWLFDVDFAKLADVDQIIMYTKYAPNAQLSMVLDGIDPDKIVVLDDINKIIDYIDLDKEEKVFILHDIEDYGFWSAEKVADDLRKKYGEQA